MISCKTISKQQNTEIWRSKLLLRFQYYFKLSCSYRLLPRKGISFPLSSKRIEKKNKRDCRLTSLVMQHHVENYKRKGEGAGRGGGGGDGKHGILEWDSKIL